MKIKEIHLKEFVYKSLLETKKFKEYTTIQEKLIPEALKGKSVIGISRTGSGKSDAFLIPLINKLDMDNEQIQAIIITPTRELATQIYQKTLDYKENNEKINVKLFIGGFERKKDINTSNPHIIIGTPARIKDILLKNGSYMLSSVKTLVLDEIDMMFEMKFLEDIDSLISKINEHAQTLVFSATLNKHVRLFVKKYLESSLIIDATSKEKTASDVKHYAIEVVEDKKTMLDKLCKIINPYLCLIFASKKETVEDYYTYLLNNGYNVTMIHGDLDSRERRQVLKRIENGDFKFVVASDMLSRGIDLEGVSHVISMDFPNDLQFYFHRAGRSGRIGNEGESYCFYNLKEKTALKKIEQSGNLKFEYLTIKNDKIKEVAKKPNYNKKKKDSTLNTKIKKIVETNKNKKIKPNYKKKMNDEIEKVKKKHHREIIKENIKKQRKKRKENKDE